MSIEFYPVGYIDRDWARRQCLRVAEHPNVLVEYKGILQYAAYVAVIRYLKTECCVVRDEKRKPIQTIYYIPPHIRDEYCFKSNTKYMIVTWYDKYKSAFIMEAHSMPPLFPAIARARYIKKEGCRNLGGYHFKDANGAVKYGVNINSRTRAFDLLEMANGERRKINKRNSAIENEIHNNNARRFLEQHKKGRLAEKDNPDNYQKVMSDK